ncbi:MAG: MarR family winged helix-turn-helix transcriptional regulator [Solirubrobacteraceae bacterium]
MTAVNHQPAVGQETEFLDAFDALAQAIRRARGAPAGSERALTLSQFSLLQTLAGGRAARVRDLADEAGIAPSTATRILDALDRRTIVRRTRSQDDRRGVTVTLTELGREAVRAQEDWMRERQRAFFEGLPAVERELAPDLLIRLAALIDELAPGPS